MKSLKMMLGLSLLLSGPVPADDMKCYVELVNGQKVVLHGTVTDSSQKAVQEKFKQRGYEINGAVQPVLKLLECQPLENKFQSKEGQQQDASQLR
ncbi:TapY2 family type IVa secretion system protein [Aeromonas aquatica]|uniref:TapY2 family type IVa secretion system protein n=1 Tax=Aeromonas aquatica TaxID=558964 RepID=UPI0006894B16|nr:TapY2 family type IVa secretion system protein [Aeromonas aquatica]